MNFRFELTTTNILIAFNIFMFLLTGLLTGIFASNLDALNFLGADVYQFIFAGQIWRMVTSSFLHANLIHLGLNMYALYVFGNFFENAYDGKRLFSLYTFAGIAGSFLSALVSVIAVSAGAKDPNIYRLGVGASGALFGILGFFVVANDSYINKANLYSIILLNLVIGASFAGVIDNWAHIGGLLAGIIYGLLNNRYQYKLNYFKIFKVNAGKYMYLPELGFYFAFAITVLSYIALVGHNFYQIF